VTLTLRAPPEGLPAPTRWRIRNSRGAVVARGRIATGGSQTARLRVPPCPAAGACAPAQWRLTGKGPGVSEHFPAYGPPGPPRQVLLQVVSAALGR
jgi:hypothetical protein